ncbi:MAG: Nif11 family protein [Synechococcaceae cyanobacterium]|nr:Nif11 family protein [Synechococcaceae cyanobacterium]
MDPRAEFLARVRSDSGLQRLLQDPAVVSAAVAIARAAGFTVSAAELSAAPATTSRVAAAERTLTTGPAKPGDAIDFDGDGIPDARFEDGRWQLNPQDES